MSNFNDIQTGLRVPGQLPLDWKAFCKNTTILKNLGPNNNLAYTYFEGLIVYCIDERQRYEWREVVVEQLGLLDVPFTYPSGVVVNGIDYSNRTFTFYLKPETLNLVNIGNKSKVYKGYNEEEQWHEFYTLDSANGEPRIVFTYPTILVDDVPVETGVLLLTPPASVNLGNGNKIFKDYNPATNNFEFYTIISDDINISYPTTMVMGVPVETGEILLKLPTTASIPSLYINNSYVPTYDDWFRANKNANGGTAIVGFQYKGEGTLAKPFTDTIVYTLNVPATAPVVTANSSIANGIAYYVGTGGTRLLPQRAGQKIQILANTAGGYTYAGDFSYSFLQLEIHGYVTSTYAGKLIDMDNPLHFKDVTNESVFAKLTLFDGAVLIIQGEGFWNSGNAINTFTYDYARTMYLLGKGFIVSVNPDITKYIINGGQLNNNNNAGYLTFEISSGIDCRYQGLVRNGGRSKIEFSNDARIYSGNLVYSVNPLLEAIKITSGWIRIYNSIISIQSFVDGSNPDRDRAIVLDAAALDTIDGPLILIRETSFRGHAKKWFDRKNIVGTVDIANCTSVYFNGEDLISSSGNLNVWGKTNVGTEGYVNLKNNTFEAINLDTDAVDLTVNGYQSVINTIGVEVIESLRVFNSKAQAKSLGVPTGTSFIRKQILTKGQANTYPIGTEFKILTIGTSDFTTIGAATNTLNLYFSVVPTVTPGPDGTGTLELTERCVM